MNPYDVELEDIYDEKIIRLMKDQCPDCGYPMPMPGEILFKKRDFICPKCGRDNTPIDMEEYEDETEDSDSEE